MGPVEILRYGQGDAEEILNDLHRNLRVSNAKDAAGAVVRTVPVLHRDGLG
jgi:hypothetical protein